MVNLLFIQVFSIRVSCDSNRSIALADDIII